jgi:hypothetical protein
MYFGDVEMVLIEQAMQQCSLIVNAGRLPY